MIRSTGQGTDGGLPNNSQPILHAGFSTNIESKAGGVTVTTTSERGGKNWDNNRVDWGAEWLRGNKHDDNKDSKDNKQQQRYDGGHATGERAEDGGSGQRMPWSVLVGEFKQV